MLRALVLLVVLAIPSLSGCLGGEEDGRLAEPTDQPPRPPSRPTPATPTRSYNLTDPGYAMAQPWRAGDGWDYESNQSHYRRVRVIDARLVGGVTMYYVEEKFGDVGEPPERVVTSWVQGGMWTVLNATDDTGGVDRYEPGKPLRFFRNATLAYNHTRTEMSGRVSVDETVVVRVRLEGPHQSVLFPWGYVEARVVGETPTGGGGATTRWVHRDYLNDVQYRLPDGETFKLTAAKAGDFRRGTLHT